MLSPGILGLENVRINVFELSDTVRLSSGEGEPSLLAFFDPNRDVTRETKGRIAELVEEKRPLQTLSETISNRLKVLAASKFISGYGERQRQDLARKNGRAITVIVKSFINDKLKGHTYSELLFWYKQLYPRLYEKTVKIEEAEEVCHYINTFNSADSLVLKEVAFVSVLNGTNAYKKQKFYRGATR